MTISLPRIPGTGAAGIDAAALDQAAEWLMRLHQGDATDADRQACRQWQNASADNARAWARAEALMSRLGGLPPALAMPVLQRPSSRRAAVAKLACLLAAAPAVWLGWRSYDESGWSADHHTATGQRRDIQLADGTRVTLNTASAIDVRYDAQRRLVRLRSGEIMIATAPDTAALARPFYVQTAEGLLQALGTRFSVRQEQGRSRLAVFEHAVRIEPQRVPASGWLTLRAGAKASFSADAIETPNALGPADDAWTRGMLLADGMPLADFSAELGRYLPGLLRCDPEVAGLRISGAFPLDQPERILSMLVSTYPVRALRRFGGYWVTLSARG